MLYNSTPGSVGAFTPEESSYQGYYNLSQGLPYYHGRSTIASIPEYQRNPWMMADDLVMNLQEGRKNLMKLLFEFASKNGRVTRPDVKFRYRVNIEPHQRFYLKQGAYTTSALQTTFSLTSYSRPSQSYPTSSGNPKTVGNIARLQEGDYLLLMFSWLDRDRAGTPHVGETYNYPIPEICKVLSVDYAGNTFTVLRNWAGSRRQTTPGTPPTVTVIANTSTPSSNQVRERDAFFMLLPNAMAEDEIDQKIYSVTGTWAEGIMQRSVRAWGAGAMQEIINKNLGNGSILDKNKTMAVERFWEQHELSALWGEQSEGWDPETNLWYGTTDGLLTNVPKSHYVGLVPINYANIRVRPEKAFGSFDIPIFNKILEDKGYIGSQNKVMLCGANFYTNFATMINYMTQNVPEIKSEWKVTGRRFSSSNGLTVDFVPSDTMSLNGMTNKGILMDPSTFRMIQLANYPTDIVQIANENPLKSNGFIHGVFAFVNLNPDSTWVFTLDSALDSATLASYQSYMLGVEHT